MNRVAPLRLAVTLSVAVSGCVAPLDREPEGQILLHIDTNAPLPLAAEEPVDREYPPPLFDRVRIDFYEPDAPTPCADCSRVFVLTRKRLAEGLSIGFMPMPGVTGYRARVRLYRQVFLERTRPIEKTTLDATVALPPIDSEGVVEGTVFLAAHHVGKPQGTPDAPVAWIAGSPPPGVDVWKLAHRTPCAGSPRKSEVCIPGGAFWLGHPFAAGGPNRDDPAAPRLTVVSPYFLDRAEVTVGAYRQWLLERNREHDGDPASAPAEPDRLAPRDWCTFPKQLADGSRDRQPLNCISSDRARQYCSERDPLASAYLPTEAQLEYVSGAFESRLYSWGDRPPECADAVFARGGAGQFANSLPGECRPLESFGGPDEVEPDGDGVLVRDLAGNLAELTRDAWSQQGDEHGCRAGPLLVDPECTSVSSSPRHVAKGGSWGSEPYELRAAYRAPISAPYSEKYADTRLGPLVGFRCARPAVQLE
jgi:formylglycine-generating enzyme